MFDFSLLMQILILAVLVTIAIFIDSLNVRVEKLLGELGHIRFRIQNKPSNRPRR